MHPVHPEIVVVSLPTSDFEILERSVFKSQKVSDEVVHVLVGLHQGCCGDVLVVPQSLVKESQIFVVKVEQQVEDHVVVHLFVSVVFEKHRAVEFWDGSSDDDLEQPVLRVFSEKFV